MINLIFPLTLVDDKSLEFIDKTKKRKDINFLIGVTEENKGKIKISSTLKNVKVIVFENGSKKEEIINALKDYAVGGTMLFVRKPISQQEIDRFISSKTDITFCERKSQGKFKDFWHSLSRKIIKLIFGFAPYDGDSSVVMFGSQPSDILKEAENVSYATRVDRWKGYSYSTVQVDGKPAKVEYRKKDVALNLGIWIFLFLAGIAGTVLYFVFKQASFLSVFITICGLFLLGTAVFISIALALLKTHVGERYYKKAREIKRGDK